MADGTEQAVFHSIYFLQLGLLRYEFCLLYPDLFIEVLCTAITEENATTCDYQEANSNQVKNIGLLIEQ